MNANLLIIGLMLLVIIPFGIMENLGIINVITLGIAGYFITEGIKHEN